MLQKKELLDIAMSMDTQSDYEKFYRFAQNYTLHLELEHKTDPSTLFECIRYCHDKPKIAKNRTGIGGKNVESLVLWSDYLLNKKELRKLSVTELNYIFACCARYCKAKTR